MPWCFLAAGGTDVFSGRRVLVADGWLPLPGPIRPLEESDLPRWIDDELWVAESAGDRARLVRREPRWSPSKARRFAVACAGRSIARAAEALAEHGAHGLAGRIRSMAPEEIRGWAAGAAIGHLPDAVAQAADVASLLAGRRPDEWGETGHRASSTHSPAVIAANVAFVVAHAAGLEEARRRGPGAYDVGMARERAWQAELLRELLVNDMPECAVT